MSCRSVSLTLASPRRQLKDYHHSNATVEREDYLGVVQRLRSPNILDGIWWFTWQVCCAVAAWMGVLDLSERRKKKITVYCTLVVPA